VRSRDVGSRRSARLHGHDREDFFPGVRNSCQAHEKSSSKEKSSRWRRAVGALGSPARPGAGAAAGVATAHRDDRPPAPAQRPDQMEDYIPQVVAFDMRQGEAKRVEKLIAFYSSRDPAVSDTLVRARRSRRRDVRARAEQCALATTRHRVDLRVAALVEGGTGTPPRMSAGTQQVLSRYSATHRLPARTVARQRGWAVGFLARSRWRPFQHMLTIAVGAADGPIFQGACGPEKRP
jgi:hypothetical protein